MLVLHLNYLIFLSNHGELWSILVNIPQIHENNEYAAAYSWSSLDMPIMSSVDGLFLYSVILADFMFTFSNNWQETNIHISNYNY